jgi:single-strand DNA-binding protein
MSATRQGFDTTREQARRTARAAAALAARQFSIRALSPDAWLVRTETGRRCRVSRDAAGQWACECPDYQSSGQAHGLRCKHIEGVRLWLKHGQTPPEYSTDERTTAMYHKVILVGNLGRDPEMRYTPGGKAVTNFTVATSEKWTGSDGEVHERTAWWRVSAFGKLGEVCNEYLSAGQKVLVEGTMNPDPKTGGPHIWTGPDGEARATYEMKALLVKFLSSGKNSAKGAAAKAALEPAVAEPAVADDNIPF